MTSVTCRWAFLRTETTATLIHHVIITVLREQAVLCVLGGAIRSSSGVTRQCILQHMSRIVVVIIVVGRGLREE